MPLDTDPARTWLDKIIRMEKEWPRDLKNALVSFVKYMEQPSSRSSCEENGQADKVSDLHLLLMGVS